MNRISDTLRVTEEELLAKVDDLLRRSILSTEDVFISEQHQTAKRFQ